jgi:hypothetical protein
VSAQPGPRSRARPELTTVAPDARFASWSPGDLARRRSLVTARAELEAAELRGEPIPVVDAWLAVIAAIRAAEHDRPDPSAADR